MKMLAVAAATLLLATMPNANLKFSFKDTEGKKVSLSDFKGKVIILDFWATWCVPCKAEIPRVIELQKRYGAGLQIIGLSVDDPPSTARKYALEMKMNYPVLLAEGKEDILKAYRSHPEYPGKHHHRSTGAHRQPPPRDRRDGRVREEISALF